MQARVELDSLKSSNEESSEAAQVMVSILDLPDGILERILLSTCFSFLSERRIEKVSMPQVESLSSVCTRWRDVLACSCKRAVLSIREDADVALHELRPLKSVTHVSVMQRAADRDPGFLRGLATRFPHFPLLTSLSLQFSGIEKVLDNLSLFLSLETNVQDLYLAFENPDHILDSDDEHSDSYQRYQKALEDLDFTKQARLKKLTLDCYGFWFPPSILKGCCFPVSPTIAQLASLEELRLAVTTSTAPLPPWLAELPAFVSLRVWLSLKTPLLVWDSLRSMTGLRELQLHFTKPGEQEAGLVSRMSHLTALEIRWTMEIGLEGTIRRGPLLLSSTLRKLSLIADVVPPIARPLPLLEDLHLAVETAVPASYFAFTPGLCKLSMALSRGVAWPHLGHLTQLTSLSLTLIDPFISVEAGPEEPLWHMCRTHTRTLQLLLLRCCRVLSLVDGLLTLERHVAVSLFCTCSRRWFDSHAEYAAAQASSPCRKLPPGDARQLFKDTRGPALRPPAPGPCSVCPSPTSRASSMR